MENLDMSGILTAVSEMSWILLKVGEMSGKKSRQGKKRPKYVAFLPLPPTITLVQALVTLNMAGVP